MQNDWLGPARYLDGAIGVAGVDDVGGIGTSPKRRLAGHKVQRSAAAESITDPISLRRHFPAVLKEVLARQFRNTMPVQAGHHAQFCARTGCALPPGRTDMLFGL